MILSKKSRKVLLGVSAAAVMAAGVATNHWATASDHAGTVQTVSKPGTDLTDLHIFPGSNANNVVLAMSVRPLIPAGQATPSKFSFDTDVLYQFKIDNTGDNVEDLVIQAKFFDTGANQRCFISGPVKPTRTGTINVRETPLATSGVINQTFAPTAGMQVFAGFREDPFFFDLEQFGNILPDRLVPPGLKPPPPPGQENTPMAASWRPPGAAKDFLANFNVLALVIEMPKAKLGNGKIRVWETTSVAR